MLQSKPLRTQYMMLTSSHSYCLTVDDQHYSTSCVCQTALHGVAYRGEDRNMVSGPSSILTRAEKYLYTIILRDSVHSDADFSADK